MKNSKLFILIAALVPLAAIAAVGVVTNTSTVVLKVGTSNVAPFSSMDACEGAKATRIAADGNGRTTGSATYSCTDTKKSVVKFVAAPPVIPPVIPPVEPPVVPPVTPPTGRVLSVAVNGSASSDCIASPCTLQRAENLAKPGDTIQASAGQYPELQIRHWGAADKWITLQGKEAGVKIRGAGIGPSVYLYDSGCDEYAPAGSVCPSAFWVFENLTILGSAKGTGDGNAIKIDLSDVVIRNSKLCCSYADIVKSVRTASRITLEHNEIWQDGTITPISANAQGVDKTGGSDLRVVKNYFHDLPNIATYAKGNACRVVISGNLAYNVGGPDAQHAFMLGQQTDASRLVKGCDEQTILTYESLKSRLENNLIINSTGGCFGVSSSYDAKVLNNKCLNVGTGGRAAVYLTNESVADGRRASTKVEIANNIIQNTTSTKGFSDTDELPMDPWSSLNFHDNVFFSSAGAMNFVEKSSNCYQTCTMAQWTTVLTGLGATVTGNTQGNPNLDAAALKAAWLSAWK